MAALAATSAIALAIPLIVAWRAREQPTVQLRDAGAQIEALLDARRAEASAPSTRLVLEPLDELTARKFFPALRHERSLWRFDPRVYYRRVGPARLRKVFAEHAAGGWTVVVDSRGLREDREIDLQAGGLRVLVTGDSHTEGVCPNQDAFTHVLERAWNEAHRERPLQALNAGVGGYQPYNYVGVIDVYAELEPDLLVVVAYGGNDFAEMMPLQRYYARSGSPVRASGPLGDPRDLERDLVGPVAQELHQALYFANNPGDEAPCVETLALLAAEIERRCATHGARALFVYLPPPFVSQRRVFEAELARVREHIPLGDQALAVSDRIADAWLARLRERGASVLDLRAAFRAADERLYWQRDHHINLAGHRVVAAELLPAVEALLR